MCILYQRNYAAAKWYSFGPKRKQQSEFGRCRIGLLTSDLFPPLSPRDRGLAGLDRQVDEQMQSPKERQGQRGRGLDRTAASRVFRGMLLHEEEEEDAGRAAASRRQAMIGAFHFPQPDDFDLAEAAVPRSETSMLIEKHGLSDVPHTATER